MEWECRSFPDLRRKKKLQKEQFWDFHLQKKMEREISTLCITGVFSCLIVGKICKDRKRDLQAEGTVFAESGGMRMIYMDNAATTMRKPKEVAEAVMHAMNSMGNAGRGANEASLSAARVIYDTRELLADFFDAENPKQIVFTSNSTESLNIAIKGILNPKDHAITTMLEHNSVLRPLYEMEERGVELSIVKMRP